ncbi:choice-of-anchor J domain-containing protein [Corallibacter sp.]|uniref:choice-of-anchor J domain-containing protein n=1 Tax=Corallibacter sp. TaxID=2038084 RepID=UPI003A9366D1
MKKITLLCIAIFCFAFSWQANAQFTESFDTEIPASWTITDVDGGDTWVHNTSDNYSGAGHARISWDSNAHDDYLISPQFTVTSGVSDRISFWAAISNNWTETFEVRLSTTGFAPGDFTELLGSETATVNVPSYEQFIYDLSAYNGQDVYVAIRATDTDRFYLHIDEFVNDALPMCTAAEVASADPEEDCANSQFDIVVEFTSVGDATGVSDGTNTYPIVGTTATLDGDYADGSTVSLTVVHSDPACDFPLNDVTYFCPPSNIDCANATPIACGQTINASSVGSTGTQEDSGCSIGDNGIWFTFTGTGGDMTVESTASFDHEVAITSGACGSLVNIICDDGSLGTETHTFASVLNETYYVYIAHYASGNTTTGTIDVTLTCAVVPTCTAAEVASADPVEDCDNSQFDIVVEFTSVGDATGVSDGTNTYPIVGTTATLDGNYAFGTDVDLTVVHSDSACDFELGTYNVGGCPPVNDVPNGAITLTLDEGTDCGANAITGVSNAFTTDSGEAAPACGSYGTASDRGDLWYAFVAQNATVTLNTDNYSVVTSIAGAYYSGTVGALVEEGCTEFASGWPWELSGLTVGETYYLRVWDYGNDQTGTFDLCGYYLSCTAAEVASTDPVEDCANSQFDIVVEFTTVGDATGVSDGTNTYPIVGTTATLDGDYADGATVSLTVVHSDPACDFPLDDVTYSCPPACGGNFYDTGGASSDYSVDENITTTICPDVPGDAVNVTFTFFSTENSGSSGCYDGLTIYDGADTSAPTINPTTGTIWCWDRDDTTPSGTGDLQGMTISSTDASGCLTFVFTSDGSVTREGWEATVGCAPLSLDDFGLTGFTYFPNPVNNTLSLRGVKEIQNVAVYNMLGQEVLRTAPNAIDHDLDMSGLQTGAYFVKVSIGNSTKTVRIIKN